MEAKRLAAELKAIEDRKGRLTPDAVVEAASAAEHPLHGNFEWDDSAAAHQHRLWQARALIKSVRIEIDLGTQKIRTVAYVHDPSVDPGEQGYRSIVSMGRDEQDTRAAVIAEFERAGSHLRRARDLAIALGYAGEIDGLIKRLVGIDRRLRAAPTKPAKATKSRRATRQNGHEARP